MLSLTPPAQRWPEGPLGFPMPDRAARAVDALLRRLPHTSNHAYRHVTVSEPPTEQNPGERSDVSWISVECVDRAGEVVSARGMDDHQFRANPLVTLGHDYELPPIGRSLWRRRVQDGTPPAGRIGIKAKTQYPSRPAAWPAAEPWMPDQVFALIQAGLLLGKSIGFLPLQVHVPDEKEVERHGWSKDVRLVIDRWLLLEYACVSLPANPHALVEAVSKGKLGGPAGSGRPIPFTPLDEVERAVRRAVGRLDLPALVDRAVAAATRSVCGRI